MVRRTTWYAVGLVAVVAVTSVATYVPHVRGEMYRATDTQLDLAVVDGITRLQHEERVTTPQAVRAVVVPHHVVATVAIARGIEAVTQSHPKRIILISPDHYGKCPTLLCTTYGTFVTFFGDMAIDTNAVAELVRTPGIVSTSSLFVSEHGIYSIVPYLRHFAPDARIIPIVVSVTWTETSAERVIAKERIATLLSLPDTVLVVSSDFSHYLPVASADAMDSVTIRTLCLGNEAETLKLQNPQQSDCPLCLWLAESIAHTNNFWNMTILSHTNAARLLRDTSAQETTSHFAIALSTTVSDVACGIEPVGR